MYRASQHVKCHWEVVCLGLFVLRSFSSAVHGVQHLTDFLDKTLEALELLILKMVISLLGNCALERRLGQMMPVFIRKINTRATSGATVSSCL